MQYLSDKHRALLNRIIAGDEAASRMEQEFWAAKKQYDRLVDRLPGFLRKKLYGYPTMCYLYHQRVITLLCEKLPIPEEDKGL